MNVERRVRQPGLLGRIYFLPPCLEALASSLELLTPYSNRVGKNVTHIAGKLDLLNRTKKVIGQLESVLRALSGDEPCAGALPRLAAARGAINSLMASSRKTTFETTGPATRNPLKRLPTTLST